MSDLSKLSDDRLREMAQGCTEFTCPYHGAINFELRRRTTCHLGHDVDANGVHIIFAANAHHIAGCDPEECSWAAR